MSNANSCSRCGRYKKANILNNLCSTCLHQDKMELEKRSERIDRRRIEKIEEKKSEQLEEIRRNQEIEFEREKDYRENRWKYEAQSLAQRAKECYNKELTKKSLKLAFESIEEDPFNITALYIISANLFEIKHPYYIVFAYKALEAFLSHILDLKNNDFLDGFLDYVKNNDKYKENLIQAYNLVGIIYSFHSLDVKNEVIEKFNEDNFIEINETIDEQDFEHDIDNLPNLGETFLDNLPNILSASFFSNGSNIYLDAIIQSEKIVTNLVQQNRLKFTDNVINIIKLKLENNIEKWENEEKSILFSLNKELICDIELRFLFKSIFLIFNVYFVYNLLLPVFDGHFVSTLILSPIYFSIFLYICSQSLNENKENKSVIEELSSHKNKIIYNRDSIYNVFGISLFDLNKIENKKIVYLTPKDGVIYAIIIVFLLLSFLIKLSNNNNNPNSNYNQQNINYSESTSPAIEPAESKLTIDSSEKKLKKESILTDKKEEFFQLLLKWSEIKSFSYLNKDTSRLKSILIDPALSVRMEGIAYWQSSSSRQYTNLVIHSMNIKNIICIHSVPLFA